jgi:APA family basic amino acid/polyamine antiporter
MEKEPGLRVLDASLIVVGSIVGAGIFLVSGAVAQQVRSPAAFLATWVLGGAVALSGALSNGELGGLFPRSGGEYVYLREAYGPAPGFLSGWTSFLVVFPGSIAALAAGFGVTLAPMLGFADGGRPIAAKVIGALAIVALTAINALGLRPGKWTQNVLSATKLAAFAGLLALAAVMPHASPNGLTPFFAAGDQASGLATALIPVFFAYSGWNAATYVSGEMRDPRRGLGQALALGTGLCVLLYLAVNASYLRAMPLDVLAHADQPARAAAVKLGGPGAAALLSPLLAVCVLSSMQASVLVGPRLYHAMAVDGLFFPPFKRLHASTGVPLLALLAQAAVSLVELLTGSFDDLVEFSTCAIIAFSTLTVAAVPILRARRPDAPRAFRVPGYPLTPLLFVVVNAWVLWSVLSGGPSQRRGALLGLAIVATGIPAYVAFRIWAPRNPPGAYKTAR